MSSNPNTTSPNTPFLLGTLIDCIPAPQDINRTVALCLFVKVYLIGWWEILWKGVWFFFLFFFFFVNDAKIYKRRRKKEKRIPSDYLVRSSIFFNIWPRYESEAILLYGSICCGHIARLGSSIYSFNSISSSDELKWK